MANVQTFEEWATSEGYIPKHMAADVREAMAKCWQAAHENAARICEELSVESGKKSVSQQSQYMAGHANGALGCAEAIREAANGP